MNSRYLTCALFSILYLSQPAQAALYNITAVLTGGGGFGASSFHDAGDTTPMTGGILENIEETPGNYGTYDSDSGELNASNLVLELGGSFTLTSNNILFPLSFPDGGGVSQGLSTLTADFTGSTVFDNTQDITFGFNSNYVCCGNDGQDPNSFFKVGDKWIMTLWGADFDYDADPATADIFDGSYTGSSIGMDLRLELTEIPGTAVVPLPAAAWLFGSALVGLVGLGRRQKA